MPCKQKSEKEQSVLNEIYLHPFREPIQSHRNNGKLMGLTSVFILNHLIYKTNLVN